MIYVLTGENDYTRLARRRALIDAFVQEHSDLSLEIIDGTEVEFERLQESLTSLPFLASKKMVVLNNPGNNKQFTEDFKDLIGEVPDTTDLVINEAKFDKRSSYYKYCKKLDGFCDFTVLDMAELQKWVNNYVKKWNATIDATATRELIQRTTSQFQLANELDKLCMHDSNISLESVKELTVKTPTSTIFELIDAAFSGNHKKAMQLYDEQRALQVDPIQIVAMFTWQFHVLALVKAAKNKSSSEIAKDAKMNPYVVQKTEKIARTLNMQQVKGYVHTLRLLDEKMKTSKINPDDALKALIISL